MADTDVTPECPECGSENVVRLWNDPDFEHVDGSVEWPTDPDRLFCDDCGEWSDP